MEPAPRRASGTASLLLGAALAGALAVLAVRLGNLELRLQDLEARDDARAAIPWEDEVEAVEVAAAAADDDDDDDAPRVEPNVAEGASE
jgi:hypothetical protein